MRLTAVPAGIKELIRESLAQSHLPLNYSINFWEQETLDVAEIPDLAASLSPQTLMVQVHHPGVLREFILKRDPLVLLDAYLNGLVDASGSIEALILMFRTLPLPTLSPTQKLRLWLEALALPVLPPTPSIPTQQRQVAQSRECDRASIQHHYDVGNEFYRLWLDPQLVYTCAHYEHPEMSLVEAQNAKLDLICRKLRLQPGDTLLDAGCGWGALLRWAVKHYGVQGYGITLSAEQVAFNQQQIAAEGLVGKLHVELRDYRDLPQQPTFDKAVAIGMIEHVGRKNYPVYLNRILGALKPGGLFLNHGITATHEAHGQTIGERFMHRYLFPNGELVRLSTFLTAVEDAGWEIVDVDAWRPHYALTLRDWATNFEQRIAEITQLIGDRNLLIWRLYLIGCALAFENNDMGLYQVLLRKQGDRQWNLPLARHNWLC